MGKSYLKRVEDIKGSLNLLMLLASIQLWGQNTLTEQANAMRDSDDVPFQIIEFSSPGAIWREQSLGFQFCPNFGRKLRHLLYQGHAFGFS